MHHRWCWGEDVSISPVSGTLEVKPQENLWSFGFQSWHSECSGLICFVNRLHMQEFASGLVDLCLFGGPFLAAQKNHLQ